jgi:hypothetical protein
MYRVLYGAAAAAMLLGASVLPSGASTCSGTCNPSSLNLGTLGPGSTASFSDTGITSTSTLTQDWLFDLSAPATIVIGVSQYVATQTNQELFPFSIELFKGSPTGTAVPGTLDALLAPGLGLQTVSFLTSLLTTGDYYIQIVEALVHSGGQATYTGNLSLSGSTTTVGSTPLPGTLALFAGGLGLLGFVRSRKRKTHKSTAVWTAA